MGARNPDRILRLSSVMRPLPGRVRTVRCHGCGHRDALPLALMIRKYGADFPLEEALFWLRCSQCGKNGKAEYEVLPLCEPGCRRRRG